MNKKYISLTISLITLLFLLNFFINSDILINTFFNTIKLWFNNLFPSIFVFFIVTDILNNYHFSDYISLIFGKLINKIYNLPKESCYIIMMSITSGFPSNSKLIKEQLDNKTITIYDANKLLTMTHFSNPLFIIYFVGQNFLHDKKIGIIIWLIHFLTNFLIGFLFRNIYKENIIINKAKLTKPLPFMDTLKNSITNTFNTLLNVLGIVIIFSLIIASINNYLNLNPISNMFLNGLLEITNGLNLLGQLPYTKIKAATIATFMISFGGFSIHMQVMSILNNYDINYFIYLLARILHASISSLIILIILTCI